MVTFGAVWHLANELFLSARLSFLFMRSWLHLDSQMNCFDVDTEVSFACKTLATMLTNMRLQSLVDIFMSYVRLLISESLATESANMRFFVIIQVFLAVELDHITGKTLPTYFTNLLSLMPAIEMAVNCTIVIPQVIPTESANY